MYFVVFNLVERNSNSTIGCFPYIGSTC